MQSPKKCFVPTVPFNDHLEGVTRFFGRLDFKPAQISPATKFIFLCFTNRSGSNYLAELLATDGRIHVAGENLNFDTVFEHSKKNHFKSFQEYFSFLVNHTSKNGVVSMKIAPPHIELLGKSGILDQIIGQSSFVLIERSDKLAQAISHLIAFQTGKFMSTMDNSGKKIEPVFDRELLDKIIDNIAKEYRDFCLFFGRNGIAPAHVIYEQMVRNPVETLSFVGDMIGLPGLHVKPDNARLDKQAGRRNEEWREKYLV